MSIAAVNQVGRTRSVVLASADAGLRQRLGESLRGMRWQVREAAGGAEAMAQMEELAPEALLMDNWLPDLEVGAFAGQVRTLYPGVDLLRLDGTVVDGNLRGPRRHELLHALREAQEFRKPETGLGDGAPWLSAPVAVPSARPAKMQAAESHAGDRGVIADLSPTNVEQATVDAVPELVGRSAPMLELARLIRLVAPRTATVLIEGETGTGKEVVAKAVHRLSTRHAKPFTVLNCAAIPEALLEAELFGHTRGAFTGAVQSRTGRIEAADGGTLFLDEIGEMPLALQAKMLRFLDSGELQRVGDNATFHVDVRVIAATHRALEELATAGGFRLDLYHRLAVFPIEVPSLRERMEDVPLLVEHFLAHMGKASPRKRISPSALEKLNTHDWPGNVRELAHVLERAAILAGDAVEIGPQEISLRRATRASQVPPSSR